MAWCAPETAAVCGPSPAVRSATRSVRPARMCAPLCTVQTGGLERTLAGASRSRACQHAARTMPSVAQSALLDSWMPKAGAACRATWHMGVTLHSWSAMRRSVPSASPRSSPTSSSRAARTRSACSARGACSKKKAHGARCAARRRCQSRFCKLSNIEELFLRFVGDLQLLPAILGHLK